MTKGGTVHNLSGKERGIAARQVLNIDEYDRGEIIVDVLVPEYMDVITPSYFQGLFSQSVLALGGKDAFNDRYKFHANAEVMKWINRGISRCTMRRSALG
jgi:hypothetical protein